MTPLKPKAAIAALKRAIGQRVVSDLNLENAQKVAAAEQQATGRETLAVKTDVTSEAEQQALVDATLKKFGKITALLNNVGWGEYTPLW